MANENDNERLILQAAEEEFMQKGYNGAKTTAIAAKAGVTHAMLHYYYRTKENLFQKVFSAKVQQVVQPFKELLENDKSITLEKAIHDFIHLHFSFLKANPFLINFVYNEVISNPTNRKTAIKAIYPTMSHLYDRVASLINAEVEAGNITKIKPLQLILNILSLNVATFMAYPLIAENMSQEQAELFLQERESSNISFILNAIKP